MTKQFRVLYKVTIIILAILAAMLIGSIILMTIGGLMSSRPTWSFSSNR